MSEIDSELRTAIRDEVAAALDELLGVLAAFEAPGARPDELLRTAFRLFHNVKGAARIAGLGHVELATHLIEDQLATLRKTKSPPSESLRRSMREALTLVLKELEGADTKASFDALIDEVMAQSGTVTEATKSALAAQPAPAAPARPELEETIRVEARRLDRLMGLSAEYLVQHGRQVERQLRLRALVERVETAQRKNPALRQALGGAIGELVALAREEERELRRASQLSSDFDSALRQVRLQPLSGAAAYFRRIVVETAQDLGKEATLVLDLGDVELDRQVLDGLREPLMHLLRNAVDHGIESADARREAGKPVRGEITVSARVAGGMVEIQIRDDGRGIDRERVIARGRELGLLDDERIDKQRDLVEQLLFTPGFSTTTEVSPVSGRGVGLDVVERRLSELGGRVSVSNGAVSGACFEVVVPASVLLTRALAVRASGGVYVLPVAHLRQTLRVRSDRVSMVDGTAAVTTPNGEPLRLRWLASVMGRERKPDPEMLTVVVVTDGAYQQGLVVDEVLGDGSFVSKRLPWNVRRVPGVMGATQRGEAALALVVDVPALFRSKGDAADASRRPHLVTAKTKPRILVVDDSLTSRTLERNILIGAGYEVEIAVDGEAAWALLGKQRFDLVVSDVQMPLCDGIELTRRIRRSDRLQNLPVILVTSLDRPEDVAAGGSAGANEYIVKGRFDQQALLDAVSRLL